MKRLRTLVLAIAAATAVGVITPASAAAAPYCGITWGSPAEQAGSFDPAAGETLRAVRAGRHDCFDRLVLDVRGATALRSWHVAYTGTVTSDPTGDPVALRGGARLAITVAASDHDGSGRATYAPANRSGLADVAGFATFRQVAWAGSFEGLTTVGLGVRARLPFRVFTLTGVPGAADGVRLVIDVAHRW
jgi:hypothetical protein